MKKSLFLITCLLIILPSRLFSQGLDKDIRSEKDGFRWQPYYELGKIGAQLPNGKVLVPAMFYQVGYYEGYMYTVDFSLRKGLFDKQGNMVLRPDRYVSIKCYSQFKEKPIVVYDYSTGFGVYRGDGTLLVPCIHEGEITVSGLPDKTHFFIGYRNNSCLVYNESGTQIIQEGIYNKVETYTKGATPMLLFKINGVGSGICNESGQELFRINGAEEIEAINDNSFKIRMGNSEGIVDANGSWIKKPEPRDDRWPLNQLQAKYFLTHSKDGHYGIEDNYGKTIVPCIYDNLYFQSKPFIHFVTENGFKRGLYLSNGKHVLNEDYHRVIVSDDYISIRKNGKAGVVDFDGNILLEPDLYDQAFYLKKGDMIMVLENGFYGLIDKNKELLFPTIYDDFGVEDDLTTGERYIAPKYNGRFGLNRMNGGEIFPPLFDGFDINTDRSFKYVLVRSGGVIGVATLDGEFIITPENFTDIKYKNGKFEAVYGDEIYTISRNGRIIDVKNPNKERQQYIEQAENAFTNKKYRESIKQFTKALEYKRDAITYYNRGVSYYNIDKYPEAISDFNDCLKLKPSRSTERRANELIVEAKQHQKRKELEKEARRERFASIIGGLVLATVNVALTSATTASISYYSSQSQTPSTYRYSDSDVGSSYSYSSSSSSSSSSTSAPKRCGFCGGRGYIVEYATGFGLSEKEYCSECGKTMMNNHYHAKCQQCNGTGYSKY